MFAPWKKMCHDTNNGFYDKGVMLIVINTVAIEV